MKKPKFPRARGKVRLGQTWSDLEGEEVPITEKTMVRLVRHVTHAMKIIMDVLDSGGVIRSVSLQPDDGEHDETTSTARPHFVDFDEEDANRVHLKAMEAKLERLKRRGAQDVKRARLDTLKKKPKRKTRGAQPKRKGTDPKLDALRKAWRDARRKSRDQQKALARQYQARKDGGK